MNKGQINGLISLILERIMLRNIRCIIKIPRFWMLVVEDAL